MNEALGRANLRRNRHVWSFEEGQDAWLLLNEVEEIVKTLEQVSRLFPEDDPREVLQKVRHTLATHQPRWKAGDTGTVA
jgi:hypothetical protein